VWASLAHDYLPIIALSVSSEHAFSAGRITLLKLHNRLKGDIVAALQVFKCAIRKDLLVKPAMPSLWLADILMAEEENEAGMAYQTAAYLGQAEKDSEYNINFIIEFDSDDKLDIEQLYMYYSSDFTSCKSPGLGWSLA